MYQVTKTYGPELGLSACFRQHRATHSHCSKLHGYALGFEFVFESETLNDINWVIDFGGLKRLKELLVDRFDHTTAVAADDPHLDAFAEMDKAGLIDLRVLDGVGCEKFAKLAFALAVDIVEQINTKTRHAGGYHYIRVVSCKCSEHGANSATYLGNK